MGSLDEIAAMMPGMNAGALKGAQVDEKAMARTAAIIQSMTPYERENPSVLNSSRKRRIALGSGVKVEDINKLLKQFDMMNQMMKQFSGPGASRKMKRMSKFGGMGGLGGFPGM
jgi:ffh: signal recognition particle protein